MKKISNASWEDRPPRRRITGPEFSYAPELVEHIAGVARSRHRARNVDHILTARVARMVRRIPARMAKTNPSPPCGLPQRRPGVAYDFA